MSINILRYRAWRFQVDTAGPLRLVAYESNQRVGQEATRRPKSAEYSRMGEMVGVLHHPKPSHHYMSGRPKRPKGSTAATNTG